MNSSDLLDYLQACQKGEKKWGEIILKSDRGQVEHDCKREECEICAAEQRDAEEEWYDLK